LDIELEGDFVLGHDANDLVLHFGSLELIEVDFENFAAVNRNFNFARLPLVLVRHFYFCRVGFVEDSEGKYWKPFIEFIQITREFVSKLYGMNPF
jgi:hypothetical protein